jgi:peroxiredoxin
MQPPLTLRLREVAEASRRKRAPTDQAVFDHALEQLKRSGIAESALRVGELAPQFELANVAGRKIRLDDLLARGPVVLTFYRGGWCPYCNLALRALQEILPDIERLGAALVAVSPDMPDQSLGTAETNGLGFELLSDLGNRIGQLFGLVYRLPEELARIYRSRGIALDVRHGTGDFELPLPATYVIDRAGVVRYAFVDPDYTRRAEPAEILAALANIT